MDDLSPKQKEVYEYMQEFFIEFHCIPTCNAIASHFDFKSRNAAQCHIDALVKKGYLERTSGQRFKFTKLEAGIIPLE